MSYNTHLYFADAEFPRARWEEITGFFDSKLCEPELDCRKPFSPARSAKRAALAEWIVSEKGVSVWCSLNSFRGGWPADREIYWIITTNSRGNPTDLLLVANLAYAALSWIPHASFHDLNGHFCSTPEELIEIYIPHLEARFAESGINKMFKAGVLNGDGKLRF